MDMWEIAPVVVAYMAGGFIGIFATRQFSWQNYRIPRWVAIVEGALAALIGLPTLLYEEVADWLNELVGGPR